MLLDLNRNHRVFQNYYFHIIKFIAIFLYRIYLDSENKIYNNYIIYNKYK